MFKGYKRDICNIKGCTNKYHDLLLCKNHFDTYVSDDKIRRIQENLSVLSLGKSNFKLKVKYLLNLIIHYVLLVRVYYIEHYPLETLFLYHFRKKDSDGKYRNKSFYINLISDFDYKENYFIDSLKEKYTPNNANSRIKLFSERKRESTSSVLYISLLMVFYMIYFIAIILDMKILFLDMFQKISLVGLLSIPTMYFGTKYLLSSKTILAHVQENKLYKSKDDNKKFLDKSRSITNKLQRTSETKYFLIGAIFSSLFISFFSQASSFNQYSFSELAVTFIMILIVVTLLIILFNLLWINLYTLRLSRSFENKPIRFDIYDLDKNLGISYLKVYFKNLLLYDLFIIITFLIISKLDIYGSNTNRLVFLIVIAYLISWNISSIYFLVKNIIILKKQYDNTISLEKEILQQSKASARFTKHEFLEKLNLNIFFKWELFKGFLLGATPFILRFLIENNKDTLIFYGGKLGDLLLKLT